MIAFTFRTLFAMLQNETEMYSLGIVGNARYEAI